MIPTKTKFSQQYGTNSITEQTLILDMVQIMPSDKAVFYQTDQLPQSQKLKVNYQNGDLYIQKYNQQTQQWQQQIKWTGDFPAQLQNEKNAANGYVGLNNQSKIESQYLPYQAFTQIYKGQLQNMTDPLFYNQQPPGIGSYFQVLGQSSLLYVLTDADYTQLQNWSGTVQSINGQSGQVNLSLDQLSAPKASVSLNNQKITGLSAGQHDQDAACVGQLTNDKFIYAYLQNNIQQFENQHITLIFDSIIQPPKQFIQYSQGQFDINPGIYQVQVRIVCKYKTGTQYPISYNLSTLSGGPLEYTRTQCDSTDNLQQKKTTFCTYVVKITQPDTLSLCVDLNSDYVDAICAGCSIQIQFMC